MTTTETHTTPAEACRTIATESRSLTTSLREGIDEIAADLANYPIRAHAETLREVMAYAVEGYDAIASSLDDLAADLDTPREQLITNLSAAVELLTPAEDARIKALATVQALHAEGKLSDEAAAAINQALETPDAVEGT